MCSPLGIAKLSNRFIIILVLELIPRPARSCEDPPLYLRLKMGKPMNKKIPHSTPLMSYGKKKMRPEYWFSIPKNRVDELYKFIQAWVPQLYGELDEEKVRKIYYLYLYECFPDGVIGSRIDTYYRV